MACSTNNNKKIIDLDSYIDMNRVQFPMVPISFNYFRFYLLFDYIFFANFSFLVNFFLFLFLFLFLTFLLFFLSLELEVFLIISLGLMIIATIIGNILVCLSVVLVRKLRHPSNYLLVCNFN